MKRFVPWLLLLLGTFGCLAPSGEAKKVPPDTGVVLQTAADYAAYVLLDSSGQSRCDYHAIEGQWQPFEMAWHTGQLILGLLEAYAHTQDEAHLEAARRAGDWWISLQMQQPPALAGMIRAVHGGEVGEVINFTTVSDGTAGLFRLSEVTGDSTYARVATQAGAWMLKHLCLLDSGLCYDMVDVQTGQPLTDTSPFWPDKEKVTLQDVARPNTEGSLFKDMWRFTGEPTYREAFLQLCYSLVDKQGEAGLWMDYSPNDRSSGKFHPRSNLWYAESLLEAYDLTQDGRFLRAAQRTVDTYLTFQQEDGTFYRDNYLYDGRSKPTSVCGSTVSFLGLLMLRLQGYGLEGYQAAIERCAQWVQLNRYPSDHPDPNLRGALINTRYRIKKGKLQLIQRDLGTAFGLRFLAAYAARG